MRLPITAEIHLTRTSTLLVSWRASIPGRSAVDHHGVCRTPTEAVWRAVDAIRADDSVCGTIEIHSLGGDRVARVPMWAVPSYDQLQWQTVGVDVITLG